MKKAAVIGHFGLGLACSDGQTIKTKIITEELSRRLGEDQVIRFDTHGGARTLFKAPFQVFRALKNSQNVIILPAHNGLRVNAPLLAIERHFFKGRRLHYVVIGGWLPEFLTTRKWLAKCLKAFDGIYVETSSMKSALEKQGFANVVVMPNCKKLRVLTEDELVYPEGAPYKLCTFSRVMKEKGIEDAVNAVKAVNEHYGKTVYTLDIYGQVDAGQTEWFEALKGTFPDYIRYGGVVPFDRSVDVLKDYFALLFPTYYDGEGFAGTLLDAMASGTPVIASDWRYNGEIVKDGYTGALYPTRDQAALIACLENACQNPDKWNEMRHFCLEEAQKYRPEEVIKIIIKNMEA